MKLSTDINGEFVAEGAIELEYVAPNKLEEVVWLKRTGRDTVMASIGKLRPDGSISGWFGATKPTHWIPAFPQSKRFK